MTETEQHYPLVLVTWVDCTTFRGWHGVEESLKFEPDEVETTGFLLAEEEKYLRITPSLSGNKDGNLTLLDAMTIPRSWVTKVEVLGLVSSCGCGERPRTAGESADPPLVFESCLVKEGEDCWGAPEQAYCERCGEQVCICGLTEQAVQEFMKPLDPAPTGIPEPGLRGPIGQQALWTIKGDEALDRPLTLDEHIRRGGAYTTWPGLIENIEGVE